VRLKVPSISCPIPGPYDRDAQPPGTHGFPSRAHQVRDFPGFVAHLLIERAQLPVSGFHGALRSGRSRSQNVLHTIINLLGNHFRLGHAHERGRVANAVFGENIAFLS